MYMNKKTVISTTDDGTLKTILCTEVAYRKHTSTHDFRTRPQLYRLINQVTTIQLKVNLTLILSKASDLNSEAIPDMPTEQDMERVFLHSQTPKATSTSSNISDEVVTNKDEESVEDPEVFVNEPCIVIWDTRNGREW